jgi:hypothetical protein
MWKPRRLLYTIVQHRRDSERDESFGHSFSKWRVPLFREKLRQSDTTRHSSESLSRESAITLRGHQHCQESLLTPHGSVDGSGRNRSRQSDAEIPALIVVRTQREKDGLAMLDEAKLTLHVQLIPSLYDKVPHGHSRQQIVYCCEKALPLKWSRKGGGWNES